ncbi:MAG TPA: helix-turn-helix domain-containing protein [Candidatus Dormibacteraeota bacterium]|nr:helix-turn-helix domain-containing protein [Candidatus Dormibacteraeota bacterium]
MLLTIREASRLIGRTSATVRRYIRTGRLKADKEIGKFGEEYKIRREDLLALGFPALSELPARVEPSAPSTRESELREMMMPAALFNDLLMKHEQLLVQYGMIRAGGQKLLEFKAAAESGEEELRKAEERYQALRARAIREIQFLRKHLREAEIEVEERNIEITLLQEKIKRLDMAAAHAASGDTFDRSVEGIRQKERDIARIQEDGPKAAAAYDPSAAWLQTLSPADGDKDN